MGLKVSDARYRNNALRALIRRASDQAEPLQRKDGGGIPDMAEGDGRLHR